ncbi:NAD(P)H-dependent oxidoreductase [Candidatus Saccharibacteria bacterium]|nr:MAG: NAD(P)H-dependent oxidoreductase [Candidatus Saccharibacteria bacterium]
MTKVYYECMDDDMVSKDHIQTAFNFRHAAKRFDGTKKIPDSEFELLLEVARLSPSSFGLEPWNIIVVNDDSFRKELLPWCWGAQGQLPTASHFVIFTAKTSAAMLPDAPYAKHALQTVRGLSETEAGEYVAFYKKWLTEDYGRLEAPQLLHEWAARQAYIALGNMMTVAAMRGIDSCAIEGFKIEKVSQLLEARQCIVPKQDLPVVMLALGYRIDPPKPKARRVLNQIVKEV